MNLNTLTIKKINQALNQKKFSCQKLIEAYIKAIKEKKNINAFISVLDKQALQQADLIDLKIKKGKKLELLEGIPIAIKDYILIKNIKATAGSKMLENYKSSYNATVISKLKQKGVIYYP